MSLRCAIGPADAPAWLADSVRDAGATRVALEEASVLVWFHSDGATLRDALHRAPAVRTVLLPSAGVEQYVDVIAAGGPIRFAAAKGVYARPVAEHALALLLAGRRSIGVYSSRRRWSDPEGEGLYGARITVVGGGGITRALLALLAPFEPEVTVVRARPKPLPGADRVVGSEELLAACTGAEALVLACALTPQTQGMIDGRVLDALDDHATLVNVGRGGLVVTDDVVTALQAGRIGSAMLDVTEPEPLPEGHPLWSHERCTITPHTANTPQMHRRLLTAHVRSQLARLMEGLPPDGLVDPGSGY